MTTIGKPHEETWTFDGENIVANDGRVVFHILMGQRLSDAKLAAKAPEMTRLLLRLKAAIGTLEAADNFVLFSQDDQGRNAPASELIDLLLLDAGVLP